MLKQYYHSINPSDSKLGGYDDKPSDILSRMALKKLSPRGSRTENRSIAESRKGPSTMRKEDSKASFMKKDQKSTGQRSKVSLTKSLTNVDSKERLTLKKSPSTSRVSLKSQKTKNVAKKQRSGRGSPSPQFEDIPEVKVMKTIEFSKEKYMSSRKVSDFLNVGGGITLVDKNDVTKGPDINLSSRHMSIKDFNIQFGGQ